MLKAGDKLLQSTVGSAKVSSRVLLVRHSSARMPIISTSFHFPSCKALFQASSKVEHYLTPANSICACASLA
jgi:hypothetical protein